MSGASSLRRPSRTETDGASQAILDARTLTGCLLANPSNPRTGLRRYEQERRPTTAKIVEANRGMGPKLPMQLVETRAPQGFDDLDEVISAAELPSIADEYKRIAGFSVAELNTRDSLAAPETWRTNPDRARKNRKKA